MFKLDKKPETLLEGIERYWFLVDNNNSVTTRGSSSLKKGLNDLSSQFGNVKLNDISGLKNAVAKFFTIKGNIPLHNERCLACNNLFNWLLDKGYLSEDPSRNYIPMS